MKPKHIFLILTTLFLFVITSKAENSLDTTKTIVLQQSTTIDTTSNNKFVNTIVSWYDSNMNYMSITALMAIESSFIPFPSEVVVPPAAAISIQPNSKLNIFLVVLFATLGAIIGALINYILSITLGRTIVYKFADSKLGKILMLSSEKIINAEKYFNEHGAVSTLIGRLIPGIRQLISIPAGLARMPIIPFILYTALGAGIWNSVLAIIGYAVGDNMELIYHYSHEIAYIILALLILIITYYIVKYLIKKRRNKFHE